jgi:hypothetical protein
MSSKLLCYAVPHYCYILLVGNMSLHFVLQRLFFSFVVHPMPSSMP